MSRRTDYQELLLRNCLKASHNYKFGSLALTSSPGVSGLNGNNTDNGQDISYGGFSNYTSADANGHVSEQHDWYLALSAEPTTIGSKTNFGLYFTLEYLD